MCTFCTNVQCYVEGLNHAEFNKLVSSLSQGFPLNALEIDIMQLRQIDDEVGIPKFRGIWKTESMDLARAKLSLEIKLNFMNVLLERPLVTNEFR